MKRLLCLIFAATFCLCSQAAELQVGPGGYSNIQDAIDDANSGDSVIVYPGIYYENINFPGEAITLTSLDPNDPNIVSSTVIDGSLPADVNKGSAVTFNSGEGNDSVLSGFTITGGTGSWLVITWELHEPYWNRCGGGVVCYNLSQPTITKNVIVGNTAGEGGGIYVYGNPVDINSPSDPPVHLQPVISYNTIVNNDANEHHPFVPPDNNYTFAEHGDGGAIVCFQGVDANVCGNLIQNNHADSYGGGIHFRQNSNGLIENNQINGNDSLLGGGIHVTYSSNPIIKRNVVKSNTAGNFGGGGIYIYYFSNPIVEQNLVVGNSSTNGAGIGSYYLSNPTIRNNIIINNTDGAGIAIKGDATCTVINNTIVNNAPNPVWSGGIECHTTGQPPVIQNNIIASNGDSYGIYTSESATLPIIKYNNVWGNPAGNYNSVTGDRTGINGNISVRPNFLNPDANDFNLDYNSPCINAGDPNSTSAGTEDFDDNPRKMGHCVDIGAYETWPVWNLTSGRKFESIQEAIDDANNLDTIVVTTDRYYENINFNNKNVELRSADPENPNVVDKTIIDGNDIDTVVTFESGENADCIIQGFTIINGYALSDYGGGIRVRNFSSPTIKHNVVKNNRAKKGSGICLYHSSSSVLNNFIYGNTGTESSQGGGMMIIDCLEEPNAVIADNVIAGNRAYYAGGIRIQNSIAQIVNNTIATNRANWEGIGVYAEGDTITNCIVWGNENTATWGTGSPLYACSADYSCIDGNATGYNNITLDPNFANPGYWDDASTPGNLDDDFFVFGNYHLLPGSPCTNAADNNFVPSGSITDIDGEQRIFDDIVDIGADELVTNPYDLDTDGLVDLYELRILSEEWLTSGSELQTDFYDDDYVDFLDFALWAENWLWKGSWYE